LGRGVALLNHPIEGLEQVLELRVGRLLHQPAHELVDLARALALQQPFRRLLVHPDHSGSFPPGDRARHPSASGPARSRGHGTAFAPPPAARTGLAFRAFSLLLLHPPTSRHSAISIPMLRAVPMTIRSAASTVAEFRSGAFSSAISRTCFFVTLPTLLRLGTPDAFSSPAAFFSSTAAGGVLVMNVNERSLYTVMMTGITSPDCAWVRALNCLQNSMMLMPCWPRAGPTGGAGVAAPALHCSLTMAVIGFALGTSPPR